MRAETKLTVDHEEIRGWVEDIGGRPVRVRFTGAAGDVGVPGLDLPGSTIGERAEVVSWDDWFHQFDAAGLALLYEPVTAGRPFTMLLQR
ncbi:MAG TPA: hypothetical protein VGO78_02865 [Acidimicrobiales bacterium]|jgi:hypothetical protein|nr:hypothetical protein [Acidimicrobiales bacterium]